MQGRIMAAALFFLVCVCLVPQAAYAEGADGPILVKSVGIDDAELLFLPLNGAIETLDLPGEAYAFYHESGRKKGVPCTIGWRYDAFDPAVPGRRLLAGELNLPEGYAFEGEPLTVSVPVLVYDPEGAPTEEVASCRYADGPNAIIPLGVGREELEGYFAHLWPEGEAYVTTVAGDSFYCPMELDLSRIDPRAAGAYYPVILELPCGVRMTEVFSHYALSVHVVPADAVDLGAVGFYQSCYYVQWLYGAQSPVLWASVDEGEWGAAEAADGPLYNSYGRFTQNDAGVTGLELFYASLASGHLYKFQVQYDGDRYSKVLVLDLVNNSLPRVTDEQGGDRNGGDREESPPLSAITFFPWEDTPPASPAAPAPTQSPVPAQSPAPAQTERQKDKKPVALPSETPGSGAMRTPAQSAPSPTPPPAQSEPRRTDEGGEAAAVRQPTPPPAGAIVADGHEGQARYVDSWLPVLLTGLIGLAAAVAFLLWMRKKGGRRHEA